MMSRVTGVGCSMGALAAACASVSSSPLQAAVSTAVLMGIAGEMAFEQSPAPGSFAVSLLDSLYSLLRKKWRGERAFFPFKPLLLLPVTAEKQRAALPPECGALNLQAFFIRSAERNGAGTPLPAQPSAACMRTVQEQEQAP